MIENNRQSPKSWLPLTYSDCVKSISLTGKKIKQKTFSSSGKYPVVDQGQELIGGYFDDAENLVDCRLPVVVFGDHTKAVKYINFPFVPGADGVKVLEPKKIINPKLLYYFTQYLATKITNKGYARHYQWLSRETLDLPPLSEQHRIVDKIEELFSEIDKGVESLKIAKAQLQVYRQALLKHAFEGKLTAQWRADNPDKVVPAAELLRSIEQSREERYQQQLTDWQTAVEKWEFNGKEGKQPSQPKRNLNNPKKIDATHLNLPSNWECVSLESLLLEGPTNGYSPKAGENAKGTKSLKLTATTSCKMLINQDTIKYLYEEIEEGSKYWLKPGDVLVQRANTIDYVGSTAIYQGSHNDFIYPDLMIRLRFYSPVLGMYIWHFLNYSKTRLFFRKNATGIAGSMPKISGEILKSTPVQITGYSEMEILTQELDTKLSIIDRFEDDCNLAIQQAEMLRQSILKKAFSGQLVPQDPTDEPASELLKRIQAEKADRETKTKRKSTKQVTSITH
jgi:type I restriction enzyme, S subunit